MNNRSSLFVYILSLTIGKFITRDDIMRKNNYLIVGGNSFIGINLALGLLKQGQNVKVFSRHIIRGVI